MQQQKTNEEDEFVVEGDMVMFGLLPDVWRWWTSRRKEMCFHLCSHCYCPYG